MFKNLLFAVCAAVILAFAYFLINNEDITLKTLAIDIDAITSSDDYTTFNIEEENLTSFNLEPDIVLENTDTAPKPKPNSPKANLSGYDQIYSGVFYKKEGSTAIVRVDLTNPEVRFFVNPGESPLTVCQYVSKYNLQLAINGGGFDIGGSGQAIPLAMYDGEIYSMQSNSSITLFVTNDNQVVFAPDGRKPKNAKYAVSGFNRIFEKGKMLAKFVPGNPGYKVGYGYLKRRTSIGKSGNWLNIVLFDDGISVTDEGQYHKDNFPGTTDVYNLDGGGSTNACTDSYGSLITESGRPVANIFGIYAPKK